MRPGQARFVTACQQLLALAVVLAALTPAASVVSLDIVGEGSVPSSPGAAPAEAARVSAVVPTSSVEPTVHEYPLTPEAGQKRTPALQARVLPGDKPGVSRILSRPLPVTGYGAVGVTWDRDSTLPQRATSFAVRTEKDGRWSAWSSLVYDPEHAPDPDSEEGRHARPGTDPMLVGEVDRVQVRSDVSVTPLGMRLAVIDPGHASARKLERAAIDTATLGAPSTDQSGDDAAAPVKAEDPALALRSATYTPKPQIFSRAQWGADESMRDAGSLHYFEVHAGFVHHTVNANDYTRAQVPALIRGIYAYHVRTRGWSDIGYNFLVDRFGRIWEGRYGGVDRPVVGAHTLGYNDYSFAMSAIGNYELVKPSEAVLQAYGSLFAWKLSLHGVAAGSTSQQVGPTVFQAINGHRDAASTACPGKYLYAKLPTIREYAAADQQGWSGRDRQSDLARTPYPDLVVRRAGDGRVFVIPTGGLTRFRASTVSSGWADADVIVASADLTGDDLGDLVVRRGTTTQVYPGDGAGGFGAPVKATSVFAGRDQISAVGDLDEDGHADLVARNPDTGRLAAYLGGGHGGFTKSRVRGDWGGYRRIAGAGDVDGDGHVDLVSQDADGTLRLHRGTGHGRFHEPVTLPGHHSAFAAMVGSGDLTRDARPDLVVTTASGKGWILPGRATRGYGHPIGPFRPTRGLATLGAANLTGSAATDLVGRRGDSLVILRNAGTFELAPPIDTGLDLSSANALLAVGDWDRDGHGDLVERDAATGVLSLHRGDGHGHFGTATRIGTGFAQVRLLAAVGDMTGDGFPDLMGQPATGGMRIYPGAGLDGLRPSYGAYGRIDASRQIGVGRWDADGAPDNMLRVDDQLKLYPGNGPGGLVNRARTLDLDLTAYDWIVGVGDARLSGAPDLVVREKSTGYLWLLPRDGAGFAPRRFLGEGMGGYDLVG